MIWQYPAWQWLAGWANFRHTQTLRIPAGAQVSRASAKLHTLSTEWSAHHPNYTTRSLFLLEKLDTFLDGIDLYHCLGLDLAVTASSVTEPSDFVWDLADARTPWRRASWRIS
jgi:hypothetical protein